MIGLIATDHGFRSRVSGLGFEASGHWRLGSREEGLRLRV